MNKVIEFTYLVYVTTYSYYVTFIDQVSGCPNMPPPEGAWMTRDGDIMEIGCHSGSKTWSLQCSDNQWTGAIGQCGETPGYICSSLCFARNVVLAYNNTL